MSKTDFNVENQEDLLDDTSEVGKTSSDEPQDSTSSEKGGAKSLVTTLLTEMNLYDCLLLVSFLLVTFSTLYLFFAMRQYGGFFWDFTWTVQL